jgi:hypothetical protein
MTADTPVTADPLFTAVDTAAFTERHLATLAAGTAAAVRVPGFSSPAARSAAPAAVNRSPTAGYHPVRAPTRIVRFGPARHCR